MKYYPVSECLSIAAALRAAKPRLWDGSGPKNGTTEFICWAIPADHKGKFLAKEVIMDRLGEDANNIATWLIVKGYIADDVARTDDGIRAIQEHRHAWLDSLIKEFSE